MTSFCLSSITLKLEIHFHSSLLISILCLDNILHLKACHYWLFRCFLVHFTHLQLTLLGACSTLWPLWSTNEPLNIFQSLSSILHPNFLRLFSSPFLNRRDFIELQSTAVYTAWTHKQYIQNTRRIKLWQITDILNQFQWIQVSLSWIWLGYQAIDFIWVWSGPCWITTISLRWSSILQRSLQRCASFLQLLSSSMESK